jgi:hypothetical protein
MNLTFNERGNFWKVIVDNKASILRADDFLVLTGLRDRDDRNFHDISELTFTSRLDDEVWKKCLKRLGKTSMIRSYRDSYRISSIGEWIVDSIRNNEFEVINTERGTFVGNFRKLLGFEAR